MIKPIAASLKGPTGKSIAAHALVRALACLAAVAALYFLSKLSGMPGTLEGSWLYKVGKHGGWRLFLCGQVPLALFILGTAHDCLIVWSRKLTAPGSAAIPAGMHGVDRLSLFILLLLGAVLGLRSFLPEYLIIGGGLYLAALAGSACFMALKLWDLAQAMKNTPPTKGYGDISLGWAAGLAGALLYSCLALWTVQAISTAGDEPYYLTRAHALLNRLGLLNTNGLGPGVRSAFYWGNWSLQLVSANRADAWFIHAISPFYFLGGRLGALIMVSLAGGAGLAGLYRAARKLGCDAQDSLIACGFLWVCPAYLVLSQHVYPELLGAALAIWGLNLVLTSAGRRWQRLVGVFLLAALITLIKMRLGPIGLGLVLASINRECIWPLIKQKAARLAVLLATFGAVVFVLWILPGIKHLFTDLALETSRTLYEHLYNLPDIFTLKVWSTIPALILDQEYGLIWYAPWLLLALAAFPLAWPGKRRELSLIILVCAVGGLMLVFWRWLQWDAGFTPPGRFLTSLLPLFALFLLPCLRLRHSAGVRAALLLAGAWAAAHSLVICINPMWRYHRRLGISHVLAWWNDQAHTMVHRFFPSFISYHLSDMLPGLGILLVILLLGVWLFHIQKKGFPANGGPTIQNRKLLLNLAALVLAAAGLLTLAGRWTPTSSLAPTILQRKGATVHGVYYPRPMVLLFNRPGDRAGTNLVWGPGHKELVIVAKHHYVGQSGKKRPFSPMIRVSIDGKRAGNLKIGSRGFKAFKLPLKLSWGMHRLSLKYIKSPGRDQVALERILLR